MKTKVLFIVVSVALILPACYLKSVHPLFEKDECEVLPGLGGRWETGSQRWTFINDRNVAPELVESEEELEDLAPGEYYVLFEDLDHPRRDTALFLARLGKLAGHYFLDMHLWLPSISEMAANPDLVEIHQVNVHTISKVSINNDTLSISFFKDTYIESLIKNNQVRIKHEQLIDEVLITANTRELQKFITKYADESSAYEDPIKLYSLTNDPAYVK